ncbi:class I SAM-dependent methyltransferase [Dyella soli]|uniref:Class I SAM-dependent methyltransferase n=1 Tax=Dyella soli TaxID=522319 RepID=A0A4R0YEF5_9GAMM|nr:class I SAM-dependent methyltransferase [Dyella soli]TCI06520.1 hypothetical protein EZM97_34135 [Dyella soli]
MACHVAHTEQPTCMMDKLHTLIPRWEQDASLLLPTRLRERVLAMDRLEDLLFAAQGEPAMATSLLSRAQALHARLANTQRELALDIREAIMRGDGAQALRAWLQPSAHPQDPQGYDHLDALVSEVLSFDEPGAGIAELDEEMVFYQPTPARHVFELGERAGITAEDVVIDIGSGLGHVPLLLSICTGARCIGIERERLYVESARRCVRALQLGRVSFVAGDAREADLSQGTVFYLYTPFAGSILRQVLDKLKLQAGQRDIRIATLGPCTASIAIEPWLAPVGTPEVHRIALFRSR